MILFPVGWRKAGGSVSKNISQNGKVNTKYGVFAASAFILKLYMYLGEQTAQGVEDI
jgi:hypothetical protein